MVRFSHPNELHFLYGANSCEAENVLIGAVKKETKVHTHTASAQSISQSEGSHCGEGVKSAAFHNQVAEVLSFLNRLKLSVLL